MSPTSMPPSVPSYSIDTETGDIRITPRERLLERSTPTEGRIAAFDRLQFQLAVATEFFQHHNDGGRNGVYRAMLDIKDYLTGRGIPHATLAPIDAVIAAIVDADRGVESPIFKTHRKEKGGAPPKAIAQLEYEGLQAVVMECCVWHFKAQGNRSYLRDAALEAKKIIESSNWPGNPTVTHLEKIRERIGEKDKLSPDRVIFESLTDSAVARALPLEYARSLVKHPWVTLPPKLSQ